MATMTTSTLMTTCSRHSKIVALRNVHCSGAAKFPYITLISVFQSILLDKPREHVKLSQIILSHWRSSSTSCCKPYPGYLVKPLSAGGLEASITDPEANAIHIKNAKIVVESHEDTLMQVRVDLTGEETRIVFDKVLTNLGRTAPPVPGFRRQKGGKTSKVPKDFLLQILGEERVTKFVIQEIITSTLADYAKKEELVVKDNKITTIQTAEELRSLFAPGNDFGFNATLELESATSTGASSTNA